FPDGVVWVPLASVRDPAHVFPTIARRLNLPEGPAWSAANGLAAFLHKREMLLLIDNLEQVIDIAPELNRLLCTCPAVKLIVTSRIPLRIDGEAAFAVPPFIVPDPDARRDDEIRSHPAVELFIDRARTARSDFAPSADERLTIAAICRQVGGLPLAIELAAARSGSLTPSEMLASLQRRAVGVDYQSTVDGTVAWSYGLLDPATQLLFRWLTVFTGGVAPETVTTLAASLELDDSASVGELTDANLLRRVERPGEPIRLRLLEMVREIAYGLLEAAGETERAHQWHASYFADLAREAEFELIGEEQRDWYDRLEQEHNNLRPALKWALGTGDGEGCLTFGAGIWRFWERRGHVREGRLLLEQIVTMPESQTPSRVRASALFGLGRLLYQLGEFDAAHARYQEVQEIATRLALDGWQAAAFTQLANIATREGDFMRARDLVEQSLAIRQRLGDRWGTGISFLVLGRNAHHLGDDERAIRLVEEGIAILDSIGDRHSVAGGYDDLGEFALKRGTFALARGHLEQALAIHQELGDELEAAETLSLLGYVAIGQRNFAGARTIFLRSLTRLIDLGALWRVDPALEGLAEVAIETGEIPSAVSILAAVERLRVEVGVVLTPAASLRHERILASARAALDESAFETAWQAGASTSIEEIAAGAPLTTSSR
ncbi:MAG: ATP-binding protein, partial [Vicinamibacterales bacterium]